MNTNLVFRVLEDRGTTYLVSQNGEQTWLAEVSGNIKKSATEDQPTVGDWVYGVPQPGDWIYIEGIAPRKNLLARQSANADGLQKLGANIDFLLIATAVNQDFNLNRLDRYVAMAMACEIQPVILLTKIDLAEDPAEFLEQTAARFPTVDVHAVSAIENWNLEALQAYLQPDMTVAVVGSSGVGKSTLVNTVLGENVLDTGGIREDDGRGRHTTTHRSLHRLPNGAWLMDTPGLRSLALWDGDEGIDSIFQDIEALSRACKFTDCEHRTEPGCQIQKALQTGTLEDSRWQSYLKLKKEENFQRRKFDKQAASEEKKKWKAIHKQVRERVRLKR